MLTIRGKALGRKKPLFEDWSVPLPPGFGERDGMLLRDLIEHVVRSEVAAFRRRQEERRLIRVLTAQQIEADAEKGKVEMGGREAAPAEVDEDDAVATAIQAFQDGMFLVVVDEQDHRELDRQVALRANSQVTFVRLALLAGG